MWCIAYTVCIAGSIGENAVGVPCDRLRVLCSIAVMYNKTTCWYVTSIKVLLQILSWLHHAGFGNCTVVNVGSH